MPKLYFSKILFSQLKDDNSKNSEKKKPKNVGKDQKGCVQSIVVNSDSPLAKPSKSCTEKQTLPQSLEKLLADKCGLAAFRAFLRSEFSEENIEFWMACEDYKKDTSPANLSSKAKEIYEEFVQSQARKEINIDHHTRESIKKTIQEPSLSCFDEAQKQVYSLMEKDSCSRFLKSEIYLNHANAPKTCDYDG
ncbi:regulator of G-protein signaling 21-like [Acipenser oxyrinchus oxyrinchus]|uniref:Regulator of G-protein signaling 21-like n=1 Tax=Acipenser oxyrinchus oxyrinchus TaxID=40147 RepID=A0AAD8DA66_ACIOX|nr:regulator of G-protein signaling 21-like [Acipenser oxyrinchus oxyrinchus]